MTRGIYEIRNTVTNKCYVGQSSDIERRWFHHRKFLEQGIHHNNRLQAAWAKYGADAFAFFLRDFKPDFSPGIKNTESTTRFGCLDGCGHGYEWHRVGYPDLGHVVQLRHMRPGGPLIVAWWAYDLEDRLVNRGAADGWTIMTEGDREVVKRIA